MKRTTLMMFCMILLVATVSAQFDTVQQDMNSYLSNHSVSINSTHNLTVIFNDSLDDVAAVAAFSDDLQFSIQGTQLVVNMTSFGMHADYLLSIPEEMRPQELLVDDEAGYPALHFMMDDEPLLSIVALEDAEVVLSGQHLQGVEQEQLVVVNYDQRLRLISNNKGGVILRNDALKVKNQGGSVKIAASTLFANASEELVEARQIDTVNAGPESAGVFTVFTENINNIVQLVVDFFASFTFEGGNTVFDSAEKYPVEIDDAQGEFQELLPEGYSQVPDCTSASICRIAYENTGTENKECFCTYIDGVYGYRDSENAWCDIAKNQDATCDADGICAQNFCDVGDQDPDCGPLDAQDTGYDACVQDTVCEVSDHTVEVECTQGALLEESCSQGLQIEKANASCIWNAVVKEISCQEIAEEGLDNGRLYVRAYDAAHEPVTAAAEMEFNGAVKATTILDTYPVCGDEDDTADNAGAGFAEFNLTAGDLRVVSQDATDIVEITQDYDLTACSGDAPSLYVRFHQECAVSCDIEAPQDEDFSQNPQPTGNSCPPGYHYCGPGDYTFGECGDADHPEFRDRCWPIVKTKPEGPTCTEVGGVLRQAWLTGEHQSDEFNCPFEFYDGEMRNLQNGKIYWFSCGNESEFDGGQLPVGDSDVQTNDPAGNKFGIHLMLHENHDAYSGQGMSYIEAEVECARALVQGDIYAQGYPSAPELEGGWVLQVIEIPSDFNGDVSQLHTRILDAAHERGLNIVLRLQPSGWRFTPEVLQEDFDAMAQRWNDYVTALLDQTGYLDDPDRQVYVQIGNEVNYFDEFQVDPSQAPEVYAELLEAMTSNIDHNVMNAPMTTGVASGIMQPTEFLERMAPTGVFDSIDAFATHQASCSSDGGSWLGELSAAGFSEPYPDVLITESGSPSTSMADNFNCLHNHDYIKAHTAWLLFSTDDRWGANSWVTESLCWSSDAYTLPVYDAVQQCAYTRQTEQQTC